MNPQRMRDQQQIRELRIPLGILVPLDRPPLKARKVGQGFL
jgi:hypothetical protein